MKIKIPPAFVSFVIYIVFRLLYSTVRVKLEGDIAMLEQLNKGRGVVLCFWHNTLLSILYYKLLQPHYPAVTIISSSRDGDFVANFAARIGLEVCRGSSSKNGLQALTGVMKKMQAQGVVCAIAMDGPRGPRHKAKNGPFFVAAKTKALLVPVNVVLSRKYVFKKAWDKFEIPLPFSRCRIIFATPYALGSTDLDKEDLEKEGLRIENTLAKMK